MIHFKTYYGFESNYCTLAKGNEKGSVENGVRYLKRRYLNAAFKVKDFNELKTYLLERTDKDLQNIHYYKDRAIEALLEDERNAFTKIPDVDYDCSKIISTKSSKTLYISYDGVKYSIPSEYCQHTVNMKVTSDEIVISHSDKVIARYERTHSAFNKEIFDFKHYLPALFKKPRAFDNAKCIKNTKFPKIFWTFLDELKRRFYNGNKEMIKILLLHKYYNLNDIYFAMEWGHNHKTYSYDAITMILKELNRDITKAEAINKIYPTVKVATTSLNKYDELVGGAYDQT